MNNSELIGIENTIKSALSIFVNNIVFYIVMALLQFVSGILIFLGGFSFFAIIIGVTSDSNPDIQTRLFSVGYIVVSVILVILILNFSTLPLFIGSLEIVKGNKIESFTKLIKDSLKYYFPFLMLEIVLTIIYLTGFILLIIPAFYFMLVFGFSPFIMLDEKVGLAESLSRSVALVEKFKIDIIIRSIILLIFGWLASATASFVPMGFLLTPAISFIMTIAWIIIYFDLKRIKSFGLSSV